MRVRATVVVAAFRSTKAGAETPATPSRILRTGCTISFQPLNEGRGRDPGDTRPSALIAGSVTPDVASLNEGRGRDPGDTANRRGTP